MSDHRTPTLAYRTLLVHLDNDARCDARVDMAVQLAQEHGAHLMGIAAGNAAAAEALASMFRQRMRLSNVESFGVRVEEGEVPDAVARHAGRCDLAILAQPGGHGTASDEVVQRFLMQAGRPALIVPDHVDSLVAHPRVLVAWNGTREATRAMADALAFLQRAREVCVLCVDRADEALFSRLELNDLRDWLARHGVKACVTQQSVQEPVARALLARVQRDPCDLLVMGGYGHARAAEVVFGGVTHSMLAQMPVPLLISH